ncbi:heterogeneous nuclear ribonucleoprotein Q-like isoform X2 [Olea europaea var. sylvestris]|nr:heterogeneous nuclear ribonucleoprotein Q-like isoform X2 [Olea europaea var. sylvestris]XP_022851394.1 heterogeneous nuclear ribonucleoprotein Q-like isoform X2 [Olea europaea var. sylvestris]
MPKENGNAAGAPKLVEPEKTSDRQKSSDSFERVDFDGDQNNGELMDEEEIEYEEVEEEEVEEVEEELTEEEEPEEEVEEEEEEADIADGGETKKGIANASKVENEDESQKHAELLALPPHGSEVYIGGISQDTTEEDLRCFCVSIGEAVEVRIMKGKDSGENKGFAFVTFKDVELASEAIEKLNKAELNGKKIKCSPSQAKNRLFIGNIPKSWSDEDLKKAVTEAGPGVTSVQLVKDTKNSNNNKGFAFIDYYNQACAEYSRQKMTNPKFKLENNTPTVSWADPKNSDSSAASQVKAVYVKNLPKDINQDQLKEIFERHGKITKVVLPPAKPGMENNRIGFVHFFDRSSAMKALKNTEKYEIDGKVLECSLAKPQAEPKSAGGSNIQMPGLLSTYPPAAGFGFGGGAYGALGGGFGATGFAQPMVYGGGPTPTGMAMMPMLLPDGRIGYVLQQPGVQTRTLPTPKGGGSRSGNRSDSSSNRGRHSNDGGQGRRYRPY